MFSGIPISEFVDIILSSNKGDEAMYYLLHHRLNHQPPASSMMSTTVHRMKQNLTKFYKRLQHGEHLNLNEEHRQMACTINDDFTSLYPILFSYYIRCIDSLKTSIAVRNLRQQYLDDRGFEVHEQDPFTTQLSITAFWNKLYLQFFSPSL